MSRIFHSNNPHKSISNASEKWVLSSAGQSSLVSVLLSFFVLSPDIRAGLISIDLMSWSQLTSFTCMELVPVSCSSLFISLCLMSWSGASPKKWQVTFHPFDSRCLTTTFLKVVFNGERPMAVWSYKKFTSLVSWSLYFVQKRSIQSSSPSGCRINNWTIILSNETKKPPEVQRAFKDQYFLN